ncbi:TRAP transporter small permease [Pseudomonas sp. F1_0610]|uniref:TRAP transporter small permease n=1 Tax=Pseudomonas sp. F1_0610 TaxID=3114284 RepID=UPI0039C04D50
MNALRRVWDRFEEGFIVFLLAAMTLVTFVYVLLNNLYSMFYKFAEWTAESSEGFSEAMYSIGDFILDGAQAMTWSNALTKALFAWLIFFGLAYGVRTAGHIGVDALVKLVPRRLQRFIGFVACLVCLGYAGLIVEASYEWLTVLMTNAIGADDLGHFGVMQWHIALIIPVGFALVFIRYLEIMWRIVTGKQIGLGLADEAADALHLADEKEERV